MFTTKADNFMKHTYSSIFQTEPSVTSKNGCQDSTQPNPKMAYNNFSDFSINLVNIRPSFRPLISDNSENNLENDRRGYYCDCLLLPT